jgi:hypothetical protein
MSLERIEVGMVSGNRALVDFLIEVFELDELPPSEQRVGTVHRLQAPGAVIKVMVPKEPPAARDREPFIAVEGLRYLTMFVTDLDSVIERSTARGGTVALGPIDLGPGARLAMLEDPDGGTMEVVQVSSPTQASPEDLG